MIAHLNGIVDSIEDDYIILDVAGVGGKTALGILRNLSPGQNAYFFCNRISKCS